jgi:hypothetical protein
MDAELVGIPDHEKHLAFSRERICSHCGETYKDESTKCRYCGTPYTAKVIPSQHRSYSSSGSDSGGCAMLLLFIATFFIPLVGLIVGGIFAFSDDPDKKSMGTALLVFGLIMVVVGIFVFAVIT